MPEMRLIHNATLLTPTTTIPDGAVLIEGERIITCGPRVELNVPIEMPALDAGGLILAPGLIDVQLNGAFGLDFTADPTTVWPVATQLPAHGVTSFLPTVITSPLTTFEHALEVLHAGPPAHWQGAIPLGFHFEGPFLNPAKRGAHHPEYLRPPSLEGIASWSRANGVLLVTLAPELPGALEVIRHLCAQGVVVSAGHSLADYAQAQAGFEAGIRYGTHLFNTMPNWDHRSPALPGALLTDERITVGLIPDGIHVHPAMVDIAWRSLGAHRMNLVTDAMAALGMSPGVYRLGDLEVTVDATSARLSDGRLAGSIVRLDEAVRNLQTYTGCDLSAALTTVTATPARLFNLSDRGVIRPGAFADLILLTPDQQIALTMVQGHVCFQTEAVSVPEYFSKEFHSGFTHA